MKYYQKYILIIIIINIYKNKNNFKLESKYITLLEKTEIFQINFDANINNVQQDPFLIQIHQDMFLNTIFY